MLKRLLHRLGSSEFIKNSLTLSGGVAIAQVLPFLFYPVLGRIYSPAQFGLLAVITSIVSVLAVVGSGKYESGILVAKDKEEAAHLAALSVLLGFVVMAVVWPVVQILLGGSLAQWLKEPELQKWLFVCPISSFSIIVFNVYNEWCVREKYFKTLSVNKMVNAGATTLGKVFLGFVRLVSQGLVVGDMAGRVVSAAGCVIRAFRSDGKVFLKVRMRGIVQSAVQYKEFPLYTMPGRLLNTLGQSMPVLLLTAFFNSDQAGFFSMAMMVFVLPVSVIGNTLGDVYRQRANEEYSAHGHCRQSYDKLLRLTATMGISALLLIVWFLPWLMQVVLGSEWYTAGRFAQILAPAMVLSFIANPMSGLFIVANKLRHFFYWQVMYVVASVVSILLGHLLFGTIEATLILYAVMMGCVYLTSILMTRRFAKGDR